MMPMRVRGGERVEHARRPAARSSSNGRGPARATRSATEPPSASSIVYHDTSPRLSQSKIGTMAGCASCAASRASRRKRATAVSSLATCGCSILSATSRSSERSRTRHTLPNVPVPRNAEHVVVVADGPAQARFLATASRSGVIPLARRSRCATTTHAVERAQQRRRRRDALAGIGAQRAVEDADARACGTSGRTRSERRHVARRRQLAGERGEARRRQLPLVARRRRRPSAVVHSGATASSADPGASPAGDLARGIAHCQPSSQMRPDGVTQMCFRRDAPCATPASCRYASVEPAARSMRSTYGTSSGPVRRTRAPTVSPAIQRRRYPGPRRDSRYCAQ